MAVAPTRLSVVLGNPTLFCVSTSRWDGTHARALNVNFKKKALTAVVSAGIPQSAWNDLLPRTSPNLDLSVSPWTPMEPELRAICAQESPTFGPFWVKLASISYREAQPNWLSEPQEKQTASRRASKPTERYGAAATEEDLMELGSDESGHESVGSNFSDINQGDAPRQKNEATSIEMLVHFMSAVVLHRWEHDNPSTAGGNYISTWWESIPVTVKIDFGGGNLVSSYTDGGLYVFGREGAGPTHSCTPRLPLAVIEGKTLPSRNKMLIQTFGEVLGVVLARAKEWHKGDLSRMTVVERTCYALCPAATELTVMRVEFSVQYLQFVTSGGSSGLEIGVDVDYSIPLSFATQKDRKVIYAAMWGFSGRLKAEWTEMLISRV